MKTRIVYFTGTGNSLFAAREIARRLGDGCELIPASEDLRNPPADPCERLGYVFPVYMYHIPHLMLRSLEQAPRADYSFVLAVNAGEPGKSLSLASRLLGKRGNKLSAGYSIRMPSNYIPYGGADPEEVQQSLFVGARDRLTEAARLISSSGYHIDRDDPWFKTALFPGLLYNLGYANIRYLSKSFLADERCDGCGICVRVCPVKNVLLSESRPVWKKECEQCFACLQWCPREAIQYGPKTRGLKRYQNPFVVLKDLLRPDRTGI